MAAFWDTIHCFGRDERGTTAMEYVLIASAIAMVLIASFGVAGGGLSGLFGTSTNEVSNTLTNSGSNLE